MVSLVRRCKVEIAQGLVSWPRLKRFNRHAMNVFPLSNGHIESLIQMWLLQSGMVFQCNSVKMGIDRPNARFFL